MTMAFIMDGGFVTAAARYGGKSRNHRSDPPSLRRPGRMPASRVDG